MNILNKTSSYHSDPFAQSDRKSPIGRMAGKGDGDRSDPANYKTNFPESMGPKPGAPKRFKKTY